MIGIIGKKGPPDEVLVRRALAAAPWPLGTPQLRRVGDAVVAIGADPSHLTESISMPGDLVAVVAGRIDNVAELNADLVAASAPPASSTDADVVVSIFRAFGPMGVARFRGAFAGVVTDGRTLWCFRDHVGFRPLFYREDASFIVGAGTARQVIVASGIAEEPSLEILERIYFGDLPGSVPAALRGVERLCQGAVLTADGHSTARFVRYWTPWNLFETSRIGVSEAVDQFRLLLAQAVERTLQGDDVLSLSGGLDSPAVAAYAAPAVRARGGRPLGALSAVFPDLPDVDESNLISLVADRFGMPLDTYRPTGRALDDVKEWSQRLGTPVPTLSIPEVWDAYSRARALGYRNVLTGEFAELTYGKYPHIPGHLLRQGRWGALAALISSEHQRGASRSGLIFDAFSTFVPGKLANRWFVWRGQNWSARIPSWVMSGRMRADIPRPDFLAPGRERYKALQMWGLEGSTISMEADADIAAMAGVSLRRPLADVDLWEFFLSLRAEAKFPELKWKALARRALRGVIPDEILDRLKKTYFDPHVQQQVDYPMLRQLLLNPRQRIGGVDYAEVARRLGRADLSFHDWLNIRELARVHAFLESY